MGLPEGSGGLFSFILFGCMMVMFLRAGYALRKQEPFFKPKKKRPVQRAPQNKKAARLLPAAPPSTIYFPKKLRLHQRALHRRQSLGRLLAKDLHLPGPFSLRKRNVLLNQRHHAAGFFPQLLCALLLIR